MNNSAFEKWWQSEYNISFSDALKHTDGGEYHAAGCKLGFNAGRTAFAEELVKALEQTKPIQRKTYDSGVISGLNKAIAIVREKAGSV